MERKVKSPVGKGTVTKAAVRKAVNCQKIDKVIMEMELLAKTLGVSRGELWRAHAEQWHECWDCGVSLTDSDRGADPTCLACGKVWSME